jgi:EAL and modified HD-GYP domain-containing signal transduction protein
MLFDLQMLTGNAKAFINVDLSALQRGAARLLPPNRVIIEILETISPTPEVVQLCQDLRASGYVLALDDYIGHPKWEVLLPLVKFLKVDFRAAGSDLRAGIVRRHKGHGLQFLAEKVETQSELDEARALGYTFFQGYFFCKPAILSTREIPGNKLNYLQLLTAVSAPGFSREAVEELLKNDLSLVYKLLRYMNSPLLGLRGEIHGVREAIELLGETEFRRWISILAIIAMAGDKPLELIRTAITRGFFCEAMSEPAGISPQGSNLFLMGLLSVTDAILDRPIKEILLSLPISPQIRTALCGGANRFRDIYDALLAYERADWPALTAAAARLGPIESLIPDCYTSATQRSATLAS